jgi:hypothetical protein
MASRSINIDEAVQSAKAALDHANKSFSRTASKPEEKESPVIAPKIAPKSDLGSSLKWRAEQGKEAGKVLGQFKDGGKVPKTGKYKLHKGETVLTAKEGNEMSKKHEMGMSAMAGLGSNKKSKKKTHMHIEPTDNDGYITKQHSEGGENPSEPDHAVHAHSNLDALVKHVKSTYGAANTSDEEKESDESTPAPSPMAPGAPAGPVSA